MIENLKWLHLQNTVVWRHVANDDDDWDDDNAADAALPLPAIVAPPRPITAAQREAESIAAWVVAWARGVQ